MIKLFILALGLLVASVEAQNFSSIANFLAQGKKQWGLESGTAIAVVKGNRIIYQAGFGYGDIARKRPITADTLFYIASATKPFFALASLKQIQQGKLTRQTSLQTLFPELEFPYINAAEIKVENLLGHTMGIDNSPLALVSAYTGEHDLKHRLKLINASTPNAESPLGKFDYANVGYNILGTWMDKTQPWQDVIQQEILHPLAMTHTYTYISKAPKEQLALPYSFASRHKADPLYLQKQDKTMHSAGGMVSTSRDLAQFVIAQVNRGKLNGRQVFPQALIAESQQLLAKVDAKYLDFNRSGYAWGWYSGSFLGQKLYHHFGGFPGTHSHISFMPEKKLGLIILNNESIISPRVTAVLAKGIYEILLAEELPQPQKQQQIAKINQQFATKAKALNASIKKLRQNLEAHHIKIEKRPLTLTQNPQLYLGTYQHPLLGNIEITMTGAREIQIAWGNLHAIATGYPDTDSLRVELIPDTGETIQFGLEGHSVQSLIYQGMSFKKR